MNIPRKINSEKTYLVLGIILVLVVGAIAAFTLTESNSFSDLTDSGATGNGNSTPQQAALPSLAVSDQAEVIQIGKDLQVFREIILDPFVLNNGDSQQIIVDPGPELRSVKAQVEDDAGTYQKRFKTATLQDNKVYYLKWKPKEITPGQKYPVTLKSYTDSGIQHTFTLSWQTPRNYE